MAILLDDDCCATATAAAADWGATVDDDDDDDWDCWDCTAASGGDVRVDGIFTDGFRAVACLWPLASKRTVVPHTWWNNICIRLIESIEFFVFLKRKTTLLPDDVAPSPCVDKTIRNTGPNCSHYTFHLLYGRNSSKYSVFQCSVVLIAPPILQLRSCDSLFIKIYSFHCWFDFDRTKNYEKKS